MLEQTWSRLKELTKNKLVTAIFLLVVIFSFLLFGLVLNAKKSQMVTLYSMLSKESAESIVHRLEKENFSYELSEDSTVIKVDKDRVYRIRALLAKEGLPDSGAIVGYEIFDKEEPLGTTSFLQNVKIVRAKQGELSRTIQAFDNVLRARVHLAIPQRELFSKENYLPSASVMLTLKPGSSLKNSEIKAISHLVARSVERLKEKDITIVDTSGNVLQIGGEEDSLGFGVAYNMQHRSAYEKKLQSKIQALISKIVGAGNVEVKVSAEMYFDKVVTNSEVYDSDKTALRSSHSKEERGRSSSTVEEGGDISVENNLPDANQEEGAIGRLSESNKSEDINNYEISKIVQNTIKEVGTIKQISVSVLINDHYDSKSETFVPRSESDMVKIESLVKAAIGYQESRDDKVIVVHMPFFKGEEYIASINSETDQHVLSKRNMYYIGGTLLALLALLTLLLYIFGSRFAARAKNSSITQKSSRNSEEHFQEALLRAEDFSGGFNKTDTKDLEKAAREETSRFVDVLRRWINEKQ